MYRRYDDMKYFTGYDECGIDYDASIGCCNGIAVYDERLEMVVFIPSHAVTAVRLTESRIIIETVSGRLIVECTETETGRQERVYEEIYRGNA